MKFLLLSVSLFALHLHAGIVTKIFKVEKPLKENGYYQVLTLNNGRVFAVDGKNESLLSKLKAASYSRSLVELETTEPINKNKGLERVVDVSTLPTRKIQKPIFFEHAPFEPTDLQSVELAEQMFSELIPRTKWWTECYNRAHIWSRQMHKDHQVRSEKIFIFYTQKYRSEINGKWWFHVAPMVTVQGEEYVMDKEFTKEPLPVEDWEEIFNVPMERTGYRCKRIDRISEYYQESNDHNEYCNIQKTSMYYWEPSELEKLEQQGVTKNKWIDWEIRAAAKEIFWSWRKVYKEYKP